MNTANIQHCHIVFSKRIVALRQHCRRRRRLWRGDRKLRHPQAIAGVYHWPLGAFRRVKHPQPIGRRCRWQVLRQIFVGAGSQGLPFQQTTRGPGHQVASRTITKIKDIGNCSAGDVARKSRHRNRQGLFSLSAHNAKQRSVLVHKTSHIDGHRYQGIASDQFPQSNSRQHTPIPHHGHRQELAVFLIFTSMTISSIERCQ